MSSWDVLAAEVWGDLGVDASPGVETPDTPPLAHALEPDVLVAHSQSAEHMPSPTVGTQSRDDRRPSDSALALHAVDTSRRVNVRRSRTFQDAFGDLEGFVPEPRRSRAEQLEDARAAKARKTSMALAVVPTEGSIVVAPTRVARSRVPKLPPEVFAMAGAFAVVPRQPFTLQPFLRQSAMAAPPGAGADESLDSWKLAKWVLANQKGNFHVASKLAAATHLKIDPATVGRNTCRLACSLVNLDRDLKFQLEGALVNSIPEAHLLSYVEFVSSDETPMKVGVGEVNTMSKAFQPPAPTDTTAIIHHSALPFAPITKKHRAPCKLLESTSEYGMLVIMPNGQHCHITGSSPTWVQLLETTTAEVLRQAGIQTDSTTPSCLRFKSRTRIVCVDSAGSNFRCERAVMHDRNQATEWFTIVVPCGVHRTATSYKITFSIVEPDIRGQVHMALAFGFGTGWTVFCRLIREYVSEKLVVLRGRPSADAIAYRQAVIRLAMARGPRLLAKRLALHMLPNGDWRVKGMIQVFVPEHVAFNRPRIVEVVSEGIQACLADTRPTVYPRHRWTRGDTAWDEFIMLESVHGLLSAVWPAWCMAVVGGGRRRVAAPKHGGHGRAATDGSLAKFPTMGEVVAMNVAADAAHAASASEQQSIIQPDRFKELPSKAELARMENEKHRREATTWLNTCPLGRAKTLRMVLEPLRQLLKLQLEVGGSKWNRRQDAAVATSVSCNMGADLRTFPILEAAMGRITAACHERFAMLLSQAPLWEHLMEPGDYTVTGRHLAFRLISAADSLVREYLTTQYSRFPVRLFCLLEGEGKDIETSVPPCCLDAWSNSFIQRHVGSAGGLSNPSALEELRLHARLAKLDISDIEARHASLRRRLVSRSVQTHPESLEEVSAETMLQRLRKSGVQWNVDDPADKPQDWKFGPCESSNPSSSDLPTRDSKCPP